MRYTISEKGQVSPKDRMLNLFDKTFNITVEEIGIKDVDAEVEYLFIKGPSIPKIGGEGATDSTKRDPYSVRIAALQPSTEFILTIAHELVHVKQMIRGELVHKPQGMEFLGKNYSDIGIMLSHLLHLDSGVLPWEKEAYTVSAGITEKVLKQCTPSELDFIAETDRSFALGRQYPAK